MKYLSDNEVAQLLLVIVVAALVATIGYQIMSHATWEGRVRRNGRLESLGFYMLAGGSLVVFGGVCGAAGP